MTLRLKVQISLIHWRSWSDTISHAHINMKSSGGYKKPVKRLNYQEMAEQLEVWANEKQCNCDFTHNQVRVFFVRQMVAKQEGGRHLKNRELLFIWSDPLGKHVTWHTVGQVSVWSGWAQEETGEGEEKRATTSEEMRTVASFNAISFTHKDYNREVHSLYTARLATVLWCLQVIIIITSEKSMNFVKAIWLAMFYTILTNWAQIN